MLAVLRWGAGRWLSAAVAQQGSGESLAVVLMTALVAMTGSGLVTSLT